jgi:hypothetical protein
MDETFVAMTVDKNWLNVGLNWLQKIDHLN